MKLAINDIRFRLWFSPMALAFLVILLFSFSAMDPLAEAAETAEDGNGALLLRAKAAVATVSSSPPAQKNVRFPASSSGAIDLNHVGRDLQVDLPNSADEQKVAGRSAGEAFYPDLPNHITLVAQSMGGQGVRLMSVLNSQRSPQRLEYGLTSMEGVKLSLDQRGGVVVREATGSPLAYVLPPWALDANGKNITTYYEVTHNTIIQVVEHHGRGVAYPIVADPWICGWETCQYEYGKAETADFADAPNATAVCAVLMLIPPPAGIIVAATCRAQWSSVTVEAARAEDMGMCLKIVYTPVVGTWHPDIYQGVNCR